MSFCDNYCAISIYINFVTYFKVYPYPSELSVDTLDLRAGKDGQLLVSLQVQKRKKWIKMLGDDHCLYQLICTCLNDNPDKRYDMKTSRELLEKTMLENDCAVPQLMELMKDCEVKETTLVQFQSDCERLTKEKESLVETRVDLMKKYEHVANLSKALKKAYDSSMTDVEILTKDNCILGELLKELLPDKDDCKAAIRRKREEVEKQMCKVSGVECRVDAIFSTIHYCSY